MIVKIPSPAGASVAGAPTGIMFNGSQLFVEATGGKPGLFIFCTEDGTSPAGMEAMRPKPRYSSIILRRVLFIRAVPSVALPTRRCSTRPIFTTRKLMFGVAISKPFRVPVDFQTRRCPRVSLRSTL